MPNRQYDRRAFVTSTGALAASTLTGGSIAVGNEAVLADQRLVRLGINALARAPEMNYFADGHRGRGNDLGTADVCR